MTPPPLSPAAQSVLDAVLNETSPVSEQRQQRMDAAAAIRALVGQTLPREDLHPPFPGPVWPERERRRQQLNSSIWERQKNRAKQLAIAAELDGGNTPTETSNEPATQPILWNGQTDRTGFPCIKVIEIPEILDGGNTTTETPND